MVNSYVLSITRLVQRLSILVTLGCCAYVIFFFLSKNQDNPALGESGVFSAKGISLPSPAPLPVFSLKPYDAPADIQARDIFSLTPTGPSGVVENTPKGQLPGHLKVVGILIGHPSQIIIEDTVSKSTYFIDEGHPQGGITMVKVSNDQMIINYQGQDITVPVNKN